MPGAACSCAVVAATFASVKATIPRQRLLMLSSSCRPAAADANQADTERPHGEAVARAEPILEYTRRELGWGLEVTDQSSAWQAWRAHESDRIVTELGSRRESSSESDREISRTRRLSLPLLTV